MTMTLDDDDVVAARVNFDEKRIPHIAPHVCVRILTSKLRDRSKEFFRTARRDAETISVKNSRVSHLATKGKNDNQSYNYLPNSIKI